MTHQTKMPSSPPVKHLIKRFFKHLDLPKGFAVRSKHPAKNGRTQRSSTATDDEGDVSIPADILMHPGSLARDPGLEVSTNLSSTRSFGRHASDMAQTFLPFVLAVAGPIPLAGAPVKAAIGGLLEIFQAMDRRSQNKVDLESLTSRLNCLHDDLCNAPRAQDRGEQFRREKLISMLQNTSAQLTELRERCLAYPSVTQDIAACFTNIDRHMADYLVWSQMQIGDDMHKVLVHLGRQEQSLMRIESVFFRGQSSVGPNVTLGFVTLVDATGHLHPIPMGVCDSFEQFNEMLQVLFKHNTIEAQIQRRYMEQGEYDLCIDDDTQVTRLTSHGWPSIEEGTKIVMRITIKQQKPSGLNYKCHFCGAVNHFGDGSIMYSFQRQAGCSIDCRICKRRFQISREYSGPWLGTRSSNIDSNAMTDAEMHLIRNFHVQQTLEVRDLAFELLT
ncbi:hypothetical protein EDB19DRAFT_227073 [Suillus lakei]|nr:hypothetical protein EDB19DRAFT_227073 [Suillus lakei]